MFRVWHGQVETQASHLAPKSKFPCADLVLISLGSGENGANLRKNIHFQRVA